MTETIEGKRPATARLDSTERDGLDYSIYQESAQAPDAVGVDPGDGLPRPIPSTSVEDSRAPALSVGRFVCMADKSSFVIRNKWGEVVREFSPDTVERSPQGGYRVRRGAFGGHGVLVFVLAAAALSASVLLTLEWMMALYLALLGSIVTYVLIADSWLAVEPIRPQCKHYLRQLVPWPDDSDVNMCQRYCGALKNEQGELLSLANQEVLACELRIPRSPDDEKIDKFDQLIILRGADREQPEFDIDAALSKEGGSLGIFGDK